MMKELLLITIPSLVTAIITWLFTRRRNKVETDGCELSNLRAEMELYRQLLQDTKDYLQEARAEVEKLQEARAEIANLTEQVNKLRKEVEELTRINTKLDNECKALRKLLKQQSDAGK